MNQFITAAIMYVSNDPYFLTSMALTTMMSMFIGAVIYNGDLKEIKKGLVAVSGYAFLIVGTDAFRIFPQLPNFEPNSPNMHMPLAGVVTVAFVTLFYLLGMLIGVAITKLAHRHRKGAK